MELRECNKSATTGRTCQIGDKNKDNIDKPGDNNWSLTTLKNKIKDWGDKNWFLMKIKNLASGNYFTVDTMKMIKADDELQVTTSSWENDIEKNQPGEKAPKLVLKYAVTKET